MLGGTRGNRLCNPGRLCLQTGRLIFLCSFSSDPLGWEVLWYITWQGTRSLCPVEAGNSALVRRPQTLARSCLPFTEHQLCSFLVSGQRRLWWWSTADPMGSRGWVAVDKLAATSIVTGFSGGDICWDEGDGLSGPQSAHHSLWASVSSRQHTQHWALSYLYSLLYHETPLTSRIPKSKVLGCEYHTIPLSSKQTNKQKQIRYNNSGKWIVTAIYLMYSMIYRDGYGRADRHGVLHVSPETNTDFGTGFCFLFHPGDKAATGLSSLAIVEK